MVDPFRSGGFGGLSLTGGFDVGGSDFGQYRLGSDLGAQAAYLEKYQAQTAWNNGLITDDAYLAALGEYVKSTAKGTSDRISAQNELDDATYTIGRNRIVSELNGTESAPRRMSLWRRLISYDRQHLSGMTRDNEQRRELESRIADQEASLRREGWSALVRRFNRDQVSNQTMLGAARRLAARSGGGPDHQDWLDQIDQWEDRIDDERQTELYDAFANDPNARSDTGKALLDFMDTRLEGMDRSSPAYTSLARQRRDYARTVEADRRGREERAMDERRAAGNITDDDYAAWYASRFQAAPAGSDEKRRLRAKWQGVAFDAAERRGARAFQQTGDPSMLLDVYSGAQARMDPGSARYQELEEAIASLRADAFGRFSLEQPDLPGARQGERGGHYVRPYGLGAPGDVAFISQYDSSVFATSNCAYAVGAMLAEIGGVSGLDGGQMRWYAGDSDRGASMDDVTTSLSAVGLGLVQQHGMDMDAFRRRLRGGQAAMVLGNAQVLGIIDRVSPHYVLVDHAKRDPKTGQWAYYIMDPSQRGSYDGQWVSEAQLRDFGWSGTANPWGGGPMYGDVGFVTRRPGSSRAITHRDPPRFQGYATDAQGRSTVGRGGGTDRREAGYTPPGWARRNGVNDGVVSVDEFLGAVTRITGNAPDAIGRSEQAGEGEGADRARARRLLEKYEGDPRLAAIEWFTRQDASLDPAAWNRAIRHYANAVAGGLGWPRVEAGARTLERPEVGPVRAAIPGVHPGAQGGAAPALEGDAGDEIARRFLQRLAAPVTEDNIRAVRALIATENGGTSDLDSLNIFGLRADGPHDIDGQVGVRDGWAVFATPQDAIDAAAADIVRNHPGVATAFRASDPEAVGRALVAGKYDDGAMAGNAFVKHYNQLEGAEPILGGVGILSETPASLSDSIAQAPDVADLVNIDPTDPVQRVWYERNYDSIQEAMSKGQDRWVFTAPDMVTVMSLPFDPAIATEMAHDRYFQMERMVAVARASGDIDMLSGAMRDLDAQIGDLSDVTRESAERIREDIMDQADLALSRGDALGAYQLRASWQSFLARDVLGSGPVADVARYTNPFLQPDELETFGEWIDEDAQDALLRLALPNQGVTGFTTEGTIDPRRGFLAQEWDGRTNTLRMRVYDDLAQPDLFAMVAQQLEDGSKTERPAYQALLERMPVTLSTGATVWQQAERAPATFAAWVPVPVSPAEAVGQAAPAPAPTAEPSPYGTPAPQPGFAPPELPPVGPGPTETRRQAIEISGVLRVITADPMDGSSGQKRLYWYSLPGTGIWIGAPEKELPELTTRQGTEWTFDAAQGGWLVNGQRLDSVDLGRVFAWAGMDGRAINGERGLGKPGRRFIVRVADPTGAFDSTPTLREQYRLGGDFWDFEDRALTMQVLADIAGMGGHGKIARPDLERQGIGPATATGGRGGPPDPDSFAQQWSTTRVGGSFGVAGEDDLIVARGRSSLFTLMRGALEPINARAALVAETARANALASVVAARAAQAEAAARARALAAREATERRLTAQRTMAARESGAVAAPASVVGATGLGGGATQPRPQRAPVVGGTGISGTATPRVEPRRNTFLTKADFEPEQTTPTPAPPEEGTTVRQQGGRYTS